MDTNQYMCLTHQVTLQVQMLVLCNLFDIFSSLIFKLMATVRAGSGSNFMMAIQRVSHESEDYLSHMWRHLVTVSGSIVAQLSCFQNAIIALQVCQFLLFVPVLIE